MRGTVVGLGTRHPLGTRLPALLQDDEFALRLTAALDEVLAPTFLALDVLDAYVDPELAPEDFVDWLAGWVGLAIDEEWDAPRRRAAVKAAAPLFQWRGTAKGLIGEIELATGCPAEIDDSGGSAWSLTPGSPPPGADAPTVGVRVRVPEGHHVDQRRISAIVAACIPAHVEPTVSIVHEATA